MACCFIGKWTDIKNAKKQKPELTSIGEETRPRLEPRILIENERSYCAKFRNSPRFVRKGLG